MIKPSSNIILLWDNHNKTLLTAKDIMPTTNNKSIAIQNDNQSNQIIYSNKQDSILQSVKLVNSNLMKVQ